MCIASVCVCVRDGVKKVWGAPSFKSFHIEHGFEMLVECSGIWAHTIAKTMSSPSNLDDWLQNSRRQCVFQISLFRTYGFYSYLFISSSANATLCMCYVCYVRYSVRAIPRVQLKMLKMTDLFLNSATIRHARHRREAPMHETNLGFRLVWSARVWIAGTLT